MIVKNLTRYPALLGGSREAPIQATNNGGGVKGSEAGDSRIGSHVQTILRVQKMKHHVTPSLVLQAPCPATVVSPLAHEGVGDLSINMLLLQNIMVSNQTRQLIYSLNCIEDAYCSLTERQKLIVNESISTRIQLVNITDPQLQKLKNIWCIWCGLCDHLK